MKILFQGDSITDAGRNTENGSTKSIGQGYALMITGHLSAYAPGKYTFENRGISGNRIVDVYARIKKDIWNLEPDVISLLIGVNDVWHEFGGNGVDSARFENIYRMIIEETKHILPNTKFILMEPFVLCGTATTENWGIFSSEVANRADIVRKLSKEYKIPFVPLQDIFNKACELCSSDYWLADGVHPTPAGHCLIADEWEKVFKENF